MRILACVAAVVLVTGCASKKEINAYTEPSARHPSSLSFSPQRSMLDTYNTITREQSNPMPIRSIRIMSTGTLVIQGPATTSGPHGDCVITKAVAQRQNVSIGELALLIKGGVNISCAITINPHGEAVASDFSFTDTFQ